MTLGRLIDSFLDDLAIGRSPATVATYRSALRWFAESLGADTPIAELTADHAIQFAREVSRGGRAPRTTVQLYTTAVSRLYAYLVREDVRPDLPLEKLQLRLQQLRGKRPKRLPKVPADDLIERVVAVARTAPSADSSTGELIRLRNVALVETMRGSGVRVSELVSLRRGDLEIEGRRAVVTGKGSKERLIFFTEPAWRAIRLYLDARRDPGTGRALAGLPLFARHDRAAKGRAQPLTPQSVRDVVWDLARRAGAAELGLTPHRFRAWFATHLVAETGDLAAVQDLLGHESADTTRVYTRVAAQRLAEVHRQAFGGHPEAPRDGNA
ncbi:MAG TPA: tyrosine-type recombinase/integrase [Chloroflexota bacterium]